MAAIVDLNLVCIICLQDDGGEMVSVYSCANEIKQVQDADPKVTLTEKIALCSNLNLADINIKLSNQICTNCLEDLAAAWRFHKNCETSISLYQSIQKEQEDQSLANHEYDRAKGIKQASKLRLRRNHVEANRSITEDKKTEYIMSESDQEDPQDEAESVEECGVVEYVDDEEQKIANYFDYYSDDMLEEINDNFVEVDKSDNVKEELNMENNTSQHGSNNDNVSKEIKKELSEAFNDHEIDYLNEHLSANTFMANKNSEYILNDDAQEGDEENEKENGKNSLHFNAVGDLEAPSKKIKGSSNTKKSYTIKSAYTKKSSTKKEKSINSSTKICEVCGNVYKYKHALIAHMRRHNNDRQFGCELCDKAFVSNVELRRHMRVHTGQKPYPCSYCDRRFSDFGSRRKHERTHTGERPYRCPNCPKSFAYAHVLTVHLRTHTGEKKFQCTRCGRGFTKKAYLLAHLENHARCENLSVLNIKAHETIQEQQQDITAIKAVALEECIFTTTDIIYENDSTISDKLQNMADVEPDINEHCIVELEEPIDEEHLEEESNDEEYILGGRT
ncbi:zinc finger protein 570 [Eurosta solidaginis]|uniref:zinc finger protein 570 n=1 Tax=Eurosta solidaginis TaxID=178769 RepID=UPI003530637A